MIIHLQGAIYTFLPDPSNIHLLISFCLNYLLLEMRKFKFKSKRVKKFEPKPNQPDYSNIIKLNQTYFTLTGWLDLRSDISYVLEEITPDRLAENKYLRSEYVDFISAEKTVPKRG